METLWMRGSWCWQRLWFIPSVADTAGPTVLDGLAAPSLPAKQVARKWSSHRLWKQQATCHPPYCPTPQEATHDPSTYSYCLKSGTMPFLEAVCDWYNRRYGVVLDPKSEALSLIGSQVGAGA